VLAGEGARPRAAANAISKATVLFRPRLETLWALRAIDREAERSGWGRKPKAGL
jgi:hypothetical protein